MFFEVINGKRKRVMCTKSASCIPDRNTLMVMSKSGYKFKLNGKTISAKSLAEKIKEITGVEKN